MDLVQFDLYELNFELKCELAQHFYTTATRVNMLISC